MKNFKNVPDSRLRLLDISKSSQIKEFKDLENLIKFLSLRQKGEKNRYGYNNIYLDGLSMNGNDMMDVYTEEGVDKSLRPYIVLDSHDRIIDIRLLYSDILKYISENYSKRYYFNSTDFYFVKKKTKKKKYKYRYDPVPGIRKIRGGSGYYRNPKTTQEKRMSLDVETKEYVRKGRSFRNLPDAYDDIYRPVQHCWKEQSKKSKQWM